MWFELLFVSVSVCLSSLPLSTSVGVVFNRCLSSPSSRQGRIGTPSPVLLFRCDSSSPRLPFPTPYSEVETLTSLSCVHSLSRSRAPLSGGGASRSLSPLISSSMISDPGGVVGGQIETSRLLYRTFSSSLFSTPGHSKDEESSSPPGIFSRSSSSLLDSRVLEGGTLESSRLIRCHPSPPSRSTLPKRDGVISIPLGPPRVPVSPNGTHNHPNRVRPHPPGPGAPPARIHRSSSAIRPNLSSLRQPSSSSPLCPFPTLSSDLSVPLELIPFWSRLPY